ncbi:MAG: DUF3768 domain-containing protein [Pseudomonadota bacterium]
MNPELAHQSDQGAAIKAPISPTGILNDAFRKQQQSLPLNGTKHAKGRTVITQGLNAMPPDVFVGVIAAVQAFDTFDKDDDPYGDHDFGALTIPGLDEKIFWKIDVYADASCEWGAENPADPDNSFRVLTVMLASEY